MSPYLFSRIRISQDLRVEFLGFSAHTGCNTAQRCDMDDITLSY